MCGQAFSWASTGFSARQACGLRARGNSASNGLIASELSLGTPEWSSPNDLPRSKPAIDITVCHCHRRRHLSNRRTYGLLFRPEAITTAKCSLLAAKCVQLTYTVNVVVSLLCVVERREANLYGAAVCVHLSGAFNRMRRSHAFASRRYCSPGSRVLVKDGQVVRNDVVSH